MPGKNLLSPSPSTLHLDKDYVFFFNELKKRLKTAQIKAALAANAEQIQFYWETGNAIIEQQKVKKWGSRFLDQLSHDLRQALPGMSGFSKRNLEHMRRFAQIYPQLDFAKQPVSQLPWGHIIRLMQMQLNDPARDWYATKAFQQGWSRPVMEMQIESGLFERQADPLNKTDNFQQCLPAAESDLVRDLLKDPYKFDFLTLQEKTHERAIENALTQHIREFLLELGQGFAFVGTQVPLTFNDQEYFIDMLFYHFKLRRFVVVELKATHFKPEHTGQLGFYLAVVDDQLRHPDDNRTIGILLCKEKNKVVVEYALSNTNAPIGVSEFKLSKSLPTKLKTSLPSVEELEAELNITDPKSGS